MKIVLIGFATSGKTTVGKLLSKQLDMDFYDVDQLVESHVGLPVAEIFHRHGEEFFRLQEDLVILSLSACKNGVIACGGGSVTAQDFGELKHNAKVVWLKIDAKSVLSRLSDGRPLFDNLSYNQLCDKVVERNKLYQQHAHFAVDVNGKTPQQICSEIAKLIIS